MDDFIKEQDIIDMNDDEKKYQLIQSIVKAQKDLRQSHINFEYAENDLIDFYSYQIKANQSKLDYLTKLAKSLNISF